MKLDDDIHNYYEHLVLDEIMQLKGLSHDDLEFIADIACVALNRLPSHYVRHDVDETFYKSSQQLNDIYTNVKKVVTEAVTYVSERKHQPDPY